LSFINSKHIYNLIDTLKLNYSIGCVSLIYKNTKSILIQNGKTKSLIYEKTKPILIRKGKTKSLMEKKNSLILIEKENY
jgi:hypothetical protein